MKNCSYLCGEMSGVQPRTPLKEMPHNDNMRLTRFLPLLLAALLLAACGDDENDYNLDGKSVSNRNSNDASHNPILSQLQFPHVKGGTSSVVSHATNAFGLNYSIEWDHTLRAQRWTCYYFCTSNSVTKWSRDKWKNTYWGGDPFQWDPDVPRSEQPPVSGEFSGSYYPRTNIRYDRGHICASQDRMCSQEVNEQTFYMTNMMPQINIFNAGIWANMEMQVRSWNRPGFRDTLFVVKGGTIDIDPITINGATIDRSNNVLAYTRSGFPVPRYFFMALLCKNSQGYKAMGFWVEHLNEDHSSGTCKHQIGNETRPCRLSDYVVNIRQLEQRTGIDFFCNLPDEVEEHVETLPVSNVISAWALDY